MSSPSLDDLTRSEYKAGFVTEIEQETLPPGLGEDVVRRLASRGRLDRIAKRVRARRKLARLVGPVLSRIGKARIPLFCGRCDTAPQRRSRRKHRRELAAGGTDGRITIYDVVSREDGHVTLRVPKGETARVTERLLLRLFVDHTGVSPMQFLQAIRLERARQSLEHGASVTDAAEMSGFRSSLILRRAWNRQWGGSPRDARRPELPIRPKLRSDASARPAS